MLVLKWKTVVGVELWEISQAVQEVPIMLETYVTVPVVIVLEVVVVSICGGWPIVCVVNVEPQYVKMVTTGDVCYMVVSNHNTVIDAYQVGISKETYMDTMEIVHVQTKWLIVVKQFISAVRLGTH